MDIGAAVTVLLEYKEWFSLGALLAGVAWWIVSKVLKRTRQPVQTQKGGSQSRNIQVGRDLNVGGKERDDGV